MPVGVYLHLPRGPMKEETKQKISKAHKGLILVRGEKHGNWKGRKANYYSLHWWIRKRWGQPQLCEKCGRTKAPKKVKHDYFHWAMKIKTKDRNRNDWMRLCIKCHRKYDKQQKIKKGEKF